MTHKNLKAFEHFFYGDEGQTDPMTSTPSSNLLVACFRDGDEKKLALLARSGNSDLRVPAFAKRYLASGPICVIGGKSCLIACHQSVGFMDLTTNRKLGASEAASMCGCTEEGLRAEVAAAGGSC